MKKVLMSLLASVAIENTPVIASGNLNELPGESEDKPVTINTFWKRLDHPLILESGSYLTLKEIINLRRNVFWL